MAKKLQRKVQPQKKSPPPPPLPPLAKAKPWSLGDFRVQAIVLVVIGLLFYANSFQNEYAFDDGIVILKNDYVQAGIKGIPKILSTDAYDSFYRQGNASQQLSGGRYRPLSVVTFAIEQQFFGSKAKDKPENDVAFIRHVVNVLLYIFSVIVLLYFLTTFIFRRSPLTAFIATLLFLIHPIHTEVVANVKSRDEIMSFLFIILTFIYVFRYREQKKKSQLYLGVLFYFFSLLSKEYAISLLLFIPMLLYIVKGDSLQKSVAFVMPFLLVAGVYLAIRFSIIGIGNNQENPDVLNNPYKFAIKPEKLATKIEILIYYLKLLFYPNPLSFDYSYNQIPYTNFGSGLVWLSLLINIGMILSAVVLFFKRNILSFALAFYIVHLLLVSNFILDVGATMGERLVYHSSFGFVIILAVFITRIAEKIKQPATKAILLTVIGGVITFWCGAKVIKRNTEWKNDETLYTTDVLKSTNSALTNGDAGMVYYNLSEKPENKAHEKELMDKAIYHLKKAVDIHTNYVNGYLNLGVVYFKLKDYDKAKENWDIVKTLYPNNPILKTNYTALGITYYNSAMKFGPSQPAEAIKLLEKAVEVVPDNADYWYNLGGAAYTMGNLTKAREAWSKALELNPEDQKAKQGLQIINAVRPQ